jgi:hypothetical protein
VAARQKSARSAISNAHLRHLFRTVNEWRRGQADLPSRAEAIRRMIELAAKMKKKSQSDL